MSQQLSKTELLPLLPKNLYFHLLGKETPQYLRNQKYANTSPWLMSVHWKDTVKKQRGNQPEKHNSLKKNCVKIVLGIQIPVAVCSVAIYHIRHIFSSYWDRLCSGTLSHRTQCSQRHWMPSKLEFRLTAECWGPCKIKYIYQSLCLFKIILWYSQRNRHFKNSVFNCHLFL